MKELNKRLKRMERNIENSRCTLSEENHDVKLPVSKYKSLMEHGGALSSNQIASSSDKVITTNRESLGRLLEAVLSEKPSNEPMETFLDKLAIRLVELAHPLAPIWVNPSPPGSPVHSDSKSDIGQHPSGSPSSSTSRAGSSSQSLSTTTPSDSDMLVPLSTTSPSDSDMLVPLDGPFSELHPVDQTAEVPPSPRPFISLLDEMRHVSSQQMAMPRIPVPQLISKVDFIKKIQLALNRALKLLKAHKMMRGGFNFLSFMLKAVLQLIYVGTVYLQNWLDLGHIYARILYYRIVVIHPFFAQVLPLFIWSLRSLHTATIVYSCILYIQEAISLATKVDSEVIIA